MAPSRARSFLLRVLIVLLLILAGLQLVPVERENPTVEADVNAPAEVAEVLRRACYDCHSNETDWPWYSRIAPISWWVASHVEVGRADLNFSEWPSFDFEAQSHALEDIREQVRRDEMPLRSYTWIHRDARLSDADREILLDWTDPGF